MARAEAKQQPAVRVVRQRWRDLAPRVASAMALGPIVLGAVWQGSWIWAALITLGGIVALIEWARLCKQKLDAPLTIGTAASIAAAQAAYLATGTAWAPTVVLAVAAAIVNGWHRLLAAGILYVGGGYLSLLLLRQAQGGTQSLFFLLAVVWANDIGAYAVGRLVGGRRMAPLLSPGKTWSGAGGGMVCAIAAGLGVAVWFGADRNGQYVAEGLAVALSVAAQVGDLAESALKRRTGAKDSGQLIPGHGGVLDRVDGMLAAAMVAFVWQLIWRGPTLWA